MIRKALTRGWARLAVLLILVQPVVAAAAQMIAAPEKRVALLIGNADYVGSPLKNPTNDVRLLAATLKTLGFEVIERKNLGGDEMKRAVRDFGDRLRASPGAVGLFYFAGHGVQWKGVNYLLPVGTNFGSEAEVEDSAVSADVVMERIVESGSRLSMVILDACRNNPFASASSRSLRSLQGGLARMNAPSGTLIAYATAPGSVASDGVGDHGLYTQHLVRSMKLPGLTAEQVFKRTREAVELESEAQQSPREESSLKGDDFVFLPIAEGRKVNPEIVELTYWESIRLSTDSGDFENYLREYPTGKFVSLAKRSLEKLKAAAKADPGLGRAGAAYAEGMRGDTAKAAQIFEQLSASENPSDRARGKEGLAEIALEQGQIEKAAMLAEEALRIRPQSTVALVVKAKLAHRQGARDEALRLLAASTGEGSVADFAIHKASAYVALGNLKRNEAPSEAVAAYENALKVAEGNRDALANLVTVLRETGNPQKAFDLLQQVARAPDAGTDRSLQALMYQVQKDIVERRDMDRQKVVDESVRELIARFKEQKASSHTAATDQWTTPPVTISVLGFQDTTGAVEGRIGLEALLAEELGRELQARNVLVVDRAVIDGVLAELKLGSSNLADPDTQLRLGRLTAARFIAVGRIYKMQAKNYISFRLIDTETSQIVVSRTEPVPSGWDPIEVSSRIAGLVAMEVAGRYPIRGRIAVAEGDGFIINLGKRNGVLAGDVFRVLGDGKPIELNGKVLGMRDTPLGALRVASVDERMAFAVPTQKSGDWGSNLRVVKARAGESQ